MTDRWFYSQQGKECGPVSKEQLKELLNSAQLEPTDFVWREGDSKRIPVSQAKQPPAPAPSATSAAQPSEPIRRNVDAPPPFPPAAKREPSPSSKTSAQEEPSRFAHATSAGTKAFHEGARLASQALTEGAGRLRKSFGGAVATTVGYALTAFHSLIRHPFALSFYTLLFVVAAVLSLAGIVTAILFPMFVMGYLTVIRQRLNKQPVNLGTFIGFMRHGWNALWHLFMLLASFIVTLSLLAAPLLILSAVIYFTGGTIASIYATVAGSKPPFHFTPSSAEVSREQDTEMAKTYLNQQQGLLDNRSNQQRIAGWMKEMDLQLEELGDIARKKQRDEQRTEQELRDKRLAEQATQEEKEKAEAARKAEEAKANAFPLAEQAYAAWKKGSFTTWYRTQHPDEAGAQYTRTSSGKGKPVLTVMWTWIEAFVGYALLLLLVAIALFPLCSALILFFYLVLDVATEKPDSGTGFDLVYDSFTRMLDLGAKHWKEVATNGLCIALLFVASLFVMAFIAALLDSLGLLAISAWFISVAAPIYWFLFVVYVTLFLAVVCIKFQERLVAQA